MNNHLDMLKVQVVQVLVGEVELKLRTPSMRTQAEAAGVLAKVDPSGFLRASEEVVASIGTKGFLNALVKHGAELYRSGVGFLGEAASVHLAELCAVVLDTEQNFAAFAQTGGLRDEDKDLDDRKRYRGSERFRAEVTRALTMPQAINVFEELARLGDYKRILGKLLAGLRPATMTEAEQPETDSSQPVTGLQA